MEEEPIDPYWIKVGILCIVILTIVAKFTTAPIWQEFMSRMQNH